MVESVYTSRYRRLREMLIVARKTRKLSQSALADKLGKLQTYVSKYERGERRLDVIEFLDVAAALNIDPYRLLRQVRAVDED